MSRTTPNYNGQAFAGSERLFANPRFRETSLPYCTKSTL